MVNMKFYDTRTVATSSGVVLTLHYYLLRTVSHSSTIYGIKVYSISDTFQPNIHAEQVSKISHSLSKVSTLLDQCIQYLVTPTDLITALDTLMNEPF